VYIQSKDEGILITDSADKINKKVQIVKSDTGTATAQWNKRLLRFKKTPKI